MFNGAIRSNEILIIDMKMILNGSLETTVVASSVPRMAPLHVDTLTVQRELPKYEIIFSI